MEVYPVFIPALRDSFNAKDSFKEWGHQALIPFVGGSIIELLLKDLAYAAFKEKIGLNVNIVTGKECQDRFEERGERVSKILKANKIEDVELHSFNRPHYRYLQDILRVIERIIKDYKTNSKPANDNEIYIVHYPSVILQNEIYQVFFQDLGKLKETKDPSILLVVFEEDKENIQKDVLFRGKFSIYDVFPRSDIKPKQDGEMEVTRGTKRDYVILSDEKEMHIGRLLGVFAFNDAFYELLSKSSNINLTSENRFQDVLKYLCATHDITVNAIGINAGRFVSLKFPWQILKGFDFVGRFLMYRIIARQELDYVNIILDEGSDNPWKLVFLRERLAEEGNKVDIEPPKLSEIPKSKLQHPIYCYTFEDYPMTNVIDPIEEWFYKNNYLATIFLRNLEDTDPKDALKRIIEDINTTFLRGIIFIEYLSDQNSDQKVKTKISAGAHVRSSYIGGGSKILGQAILDHSIIGEHVVLYPNSVVPYAILGNKVVISGQVTLAREKARGIYDPYIRPPVFYTGKEIIRFKERFSALVGDKTKIMIGVDVSPGCRIGHNCEIFPNLTVSYNIPPHTRVRYEGMLERMVGRDGETD